MKSPVRAKNSMGMTVHQMCYLALFLAVVAVVLGGLGTKAYYDVAHNPDEDQEVGELKADSILVANKAVMGNYTGLTFAANTATATLTANSINTTNYTGAAARTLTLPSAKRGTRVVIVFAQDPAGGTAALTIDCGGSDKFETGSVVPSTAANLMVYDTSTAGETSLVFTPTNDTVNFLSYGSTIDLISPRDGEWQVAAVTVCSDIGVTAGAATGTLLFAA